MAKTVPCYIHSYKQGLYRTSIETLLQVTTSFGEFGWSADALIALLLFIQILYTDENSAIIWILTHLAYIANGKKRVILCNNFTGRR